MVNSEKTAETTVAVIVSIDTSATRLAVIVAHAHLGLKAQDAT